MTPDKIIQKAYKMATGDDEDVAQSEPAYDKYLSTLNDLQKDWANEPLMLPNERWATLEKEAVIPISTNSEQKYAVPGELARDPLNYAPLYIKLTDGVIITLDLVSVDEFAKTNGDEAVFTTSSDGSCFCLKRDFATSVNNGSIYCPYYESVQEIQKGSSSRIVVQDPNWLIYMLAAEIARSDIVQAGQYGNLVALAQNSMTSMKNRQRGLRVANMKPWGNR